MTKSDAGKLGAKARDIKNTLMYKYSKMDINNGIINKNSILEVCYYDGTHLRYKEAFHPRIKKNGIVGCIQKTGYYAASFGGKKLYIHRLIWIIHNGEIPKDIKIDHIDEDRANNKIENLRLVTHTQNLQNSSKAKGYSVDKRNGRFVSRIIVNKKVIRLGVYKTKEEATAAYYAAKKIHHIGKSK